MLHSSLYSVTFIYEWQVDIFLICWIFSTDQCKKANKNTLTKKTGRKRNNPQLKGKEEVSERMINEIEASKLSDIEFNTMVIRKLNELSENYQKPKGNYEELTANYIRMKKDIETINKSQQEIKKYNFWIEEHSRRNQNQARWNRIKSASWKTGRKNSQKE